MRKLIIILPLVILSILGIFILHTRTIPCKKQNLKGISMAIQIERVESRLFSSQTKEEIAALLKDYPLLTSQFFGLKNEQDTHAIVDKLYEMTHHPSIQKLYQEVEHTFKDLASLTKELEYAFKYLKYAYPSFQAPQIITLITGLDADMYVSKELIVIGLDFFLGDHATWKPQGMPDYLLRTYQPSYIAPKIILALSHYFNQLNIDDLTLLHDMLYQGKAYYFTKMLLPHIPESVIIGYTPTQWEETSKHQRIVWQHFIDQELFYQTNKIIKTKYIGTRPFTSEIGPGCPGNIGGWLGWKIINKYMKDHSTITLPQLMQDMKMQQIFMQAKYKPK